MRKERNEMFVVCKEYWFDSIDRIYNKRKVAINTTEISSFFDYYSLEMRRTVLRVCLKTGRYHDVDMSFDAFCNILMEGAEQE